MISGSAIPALDRDQAMPMAHDAQWAIRAMLLWQHRRTLAWITAISLLASLAIAFAIPKRYKSSASIMPPDQQGSSTMLLAALTGHTGNLGALGGLASGLLGGHNSTALYVDLLRSGSVSGHLIDRFDLMHVYHKRHHIDAAKHLARCTRITDDKKSGVITIEVEDRDRKRARDLAQGYLEQAQLDLSEFSSRSSTVDIKEQTRAMVDAGARVQAELLIEQSGLQSMRQIYGDGNVRVRETEARIASLKAELAKMTGSSAPLTPESLHDDTGTDSGDGGGKVELYPPLRQLPRLAVPYADLYRRVRVEETLYELLTQQYEMARIDEAKDVAAVNVIDAPGIPEKKSFPPRLLLTLLLTCVSFMCASVWILFRSHWSTVDVRDPRKALAAEVLPVLRRRIHSISRLNRGAA
jgi:capsule polysaccharide export protein KpsE/RkpR